MWLGCDCTCRELGADKVQVDGVKDAVYGGAIPFDINQILLFNINMWNRYNSFHKTKTSVTRRHSILQFLDLCFN